jgi:hypothetical protein
MVTIGAQSSTRRGHKISKEQDPLEIGLDATLEVRASGQAASNTQVCRLVASTFINLFYSFIHSFTYLL